MHKHPELAKYEETVKDFKKQVISNRDICKTGVEAAAAWFEYGDALFRLGRFYQADLAFRKCASLDPNFMDIHLHRGLVFHSLSNYNDAITEFREHLMRDPDNPQALKTLGDCYVRLNMYCDAARVLGRALALDDTSAPNHVNLGKAYLGLDDLSNALVEFNLATRYDPNLAIAHFGLGFVYHSRYRLDDAINEYRLSTKLDPYLGGAYRLLIGALKVSGQWLDIVPTYIKYTGAMLRLTILGRPQPHARVHNANAH